MKKGFTLIELLAVIVILAIIAIIAVPIVLDIIKDTKESAMLRSADFYLDGVENAIATAVLKNIQIKDGTYPIMEDGNVCIGSYDAEKDTCTGDILKVEVDGEKPTNGSITIGKGTITSAEIVLNDKTIMLGGGQLAITDGYTALSNFEYYLGSEHSTIDSLNGVTVSTITLAENEILLTKYKGESKEVVVPDTYTVDGITYNVVLLSSVNCSDDFGTFYENSNIESVAFMGNIKFISNKYEECDDYDGCFRDNVAENSIAGLFYDCTNLKKVILPDIVTYIGDSAFWRCTNLKEITIPSSVTWIGERAFLGSGLTSITIPDGVTSIGDWAFSDCTSLKEITIPGSVTMIHEGAFQGCTSLSNVKIEDGVMYIYGKAFEDCTSLISITIPESATEIGYTYFSFPDGSHYEFYDDIFDGCSNLKTIYYTGTKAKWNAISKRVDWSTSIPTSHVQCSDGTTTLVGKITFTIEGTEYQAEKGMTWGEWVVSDHNTGGFYVDEYDSYALILFSDGSGWVTLPEEMFYVRTNEVILDGHSYIWG